MMGGASTDYFTTDGLGSISEITNEYGGLEEYYTYDAYGSPSLFDGTGTPISTSAVNNPFYFTGREYDFETGIYYYRARYYDPALGRFLETDPLGYIDSPNLYAYVGNNPWNMIDPLGLYVKNNSNQYIIVKVEKGNSYEIISPYGKYSKDQDGIIFSDGNIFKNNDGVDVEVTEKGGVSDSSIYDNVLGDAGKAFRNFFPGPKKEYSGWYNMGDGSQTGKWDPGNLMDDIKKDNQQNNNMDKGNNGGNHK